MSRSQQRLYALMAIFALPLGTPALAQMPAQPLAQKPASLEALTLTGDAIIEVTINGIALRLEVEPSHAGPAIVNPKIAERLAPLEWSNRSISFGGQSLSTFTSDAVVDFGFGPERSRVAWSRRIASSKVDGVIGVHSLPYRRVTFEFKAPDPSERTHSFKLKRKSPRDYTRLGTEMRIGKKRFFMVFSRSIKPNLISAPTANFLATHHDGGFVTDSDSFVDMVFNVRRKTRDMRLADPIFFGDLSLDRFAVRFADHGRANKVGDIEEGDPRFSDKHILVSRRKRQGRPDPLTHIGHDQMAHCSRLTFDLKAKRGELSCLPNPERID